MAFTKFSRTAARTDTGALWLGIQGNGSISVSYSAIKAIDAPRFVFLLHDEEGRRIALQPATEDSKDAYPARNQGRDNKFGARVVSANAFFRHIGVNLKRASGRYDVTIEDGMLVAELPADAYTRPVQE